MRPVADGADHVPALYERWARVEAHGSSPVYERLALAVAGDGAAQALLARLEPARRQPNLLFGAMRSLGAPVDDCAAALSWLSAHGHDVLDVMRVRRTQTNEVARCAVLLPALALLPEPLAVLEVGASAGLCLLYDRWRYRYAGVGGDHEVGDPASPVTLECAVSGAVPLPERVPTIAWRLGLDLHPLDPADPDARAWLRALVWPEHTDRATRLSAALDVAATDPPPVETGELLRDLPRLLDRAPANTTVVVTHSATLAHLEAEQRGAFLRVLADAGVHRLGMEGTAVLPGLADQVAGRDGTGRFVVSLDDRALALADPHGRDLAWL